MSFSPPSAPISESSYLHVPGVRTLAEPHLQAAAVEFVAVVVGGESRHGPAPEQRVHPACGGSANGLAQVRYGFDDMTQQMVIADMLEDLGSGGAIVLYS